MTFATFLKWNLISLSAFLLIACDSSVDKGDFQSNKKIFLIGDSTMHIHSSKYLLDEVRMTCGDDNPKNILTGWGDELGFYAKKPDNIFNRARAGSSSVTYRTEEDYDNDKFGVNRHWSYTKTLMENGEGGFLLIQFGTSNENNHVPEADYNNDGVIDQLDYRHPDAIAIRKNNFDEAILGYINEARNMKITPILISPPDGRAKQANTAAGTHPHTRQDFPANIRQLGIDHGVAVLDLNAKSNEEFAKLSDEELLRDFGDCAKNQGRGSIDRTHYEPKGARTVAGWVKDLACSTDDNNDDKKLLCKQFK